MNKNLEKLKQEKKVKKKKKEKMMKVASVSTINISEPINFRKNIGMESILTKKNSKLLKKKTGKDRYYFN